MPLLALRCDALLPEADWLQPHRLQSGTACAVGTDTHGHVLLTYIGTAGNSCAGKASAGCL